MTAPETADVFEEWNRGPLESFLIELSAKVCRTIDPDTRQPLVDVVLDKAGQKGTGKWTAQVALDLAVAIPTIAAAIDGRILSSMKEERVTASQKLAGPRPGAAFGAVDRASVISDLRDALYAPSNFYAHEWQQGDVVVADNFSLLHGREGYETKASRHLRRVHVLSAPPLNNPRLVSYGSTTAS